MNKSPLVQRIPEFKANLRELYRIAPKLEGANWYPAANRLMREWAKRFDLPVETVAAVTAALSPQVEWGRNLETAEDLLAGRQPRVKGVIWENWRKAGLILADRATNIRDYFPHGPKVFNFARNLAGDYSAVTIDAHAAQAAIGDPFFKASLKWAPYEAFATAYREVAEDFKVKPAHLQAAIWLAWKAKHSTVEKRREFVAA